MQQQHTQLLGGKDQRQSQSAESQPGVGEIPHSAQLSLRVKRNEEKKNKYIFSS